MRESKQGGRLKEAVTDPRSGGHNGSSDGEAILGAAVSAPSSSPSSSSSNRSSPADPAGSGRSHPGPMLIVHVLRTVQFIFGTFTNAHNMMALNF